MTQSGPPKPPPPPPPRKPPPPPPARPAIPTKPQPVSEQQEDELAELAMVLREEQVQARIVHYKGEMETNAELDAITAQVVAQLQQLQSKIAAERGPASTVSVETEQVRALAALLSRIFRKDQISVLVEKVLKDTARRVTRLFFESELHEKLAAGQEKVRTMHHAEQALFYVLRRYSNRMQAELDAFEYADDEIKERTLDLLEKTSNDLRVAFLSRRSPELKRLLSVMNTVILEFFQRFFPTKIDEFATAVVQEAGTAKTPGAVGYKVLHAAFPAFRKSFERRLLGHIVGFVQQRTINALEQSEERFRDETIAFVQTPQIYSDLVSVVSDAMYDFLCNEGYLDLPIDWRAEAQSEGA